MPPQFPGVQPQPFGNDDRLWIPLLHIKSQVDQYRTIFLQDLESLQPANEPPKLRGFQMSCVFLGVARFVDQVQGNLSEIIPVYPG